MGYYINPPDETKEEWLNNHGLEVTYPAWDAPGITPDGNGVYVYLVDNGSFTAAGICYDEAKFNEFNALDPTHEEVAEAKARAEAAGINVFNLDSGD